MHCFYKLTHGLFIWMGFRLWIWVQRASSQELFLTSHHGVSVFAWCKLWHDSSILKFSHGDIHGACRQEFNDYFVNHSIISSYNLGSGLGTEDEWNQHIKFKLLFKILLTLTTWWLSKNSWSRFRI